MSVVRSVGVKRWNDGQTCRFVRKYKELEGLWNSKHPQYNNKYARLLAMQELTRHMEMADFGIIEAKNKIRSLRATYTGELAKIERSKEAGHGENGGPVYTPMLKWFYLMEGIIPNKKGIKYEMPAGLDDDNLEIDDLPFKEEIPPPKPKPLITSTSNVSDSNCMVNTKSRGKKRKKKSSSSKRYNVFSSNNSSTADEIKFEVSSDPGFSDTINEKECEIFGEYIAVQLKQISLIERLELQNEIQNLVNKFRLERVRSQATNPFDGCSPNRDEDYDGNEHKGNALRNMYDGAP